MESGITANTSVQIQHVASARFLQHNSKYKFEVEVEGEPPEEEEQPKDGDGNLAVPS